MTGKDIPNLGLNFALVSFQSAVNPVAFSQSALNCSESTDSPRCRKSTLAPAFNINDSISNLFSRYTAPMIGFASKTHLVLPYSGKGPGGSGYVILSPGSVKYC